MDCNKEEAERATNLAEQKMNARDFVGARKLIEKAQRLFPSLQNLPQMRAICDVHSSADEKIPGLDSWYGILQVQCHDDAHTVKKQYLKLAMLLHPDKNKFAGAEDAFKLIGEANRCLSAQFNRSQETYSSSRSDKVPPSTGSAASGPDLAGLKEDHAIKKRFLEAKKALMAEMAVHEREMEEFRKYKAKMHSEWEEMFSNIKRRYPAAWSTDHTEEVESDHTEEVESDSD